MSEQMECPWGKCEECNYTGIITCYSINELSSFLDLDADDD